MTEGRCFLEMTKFWGCIPEQVRDWCDRRAKEVVTKPEMLAVIRFQAFFSRTACQGQGLKCYYEFVRHQRTLKTKYSKGFRSV